MVSLVVYQTKPPKEGKRSIDGHGLKKIARWAKVVGGSKEIKQEILSDILFVEKEGD